MIGVTMLWRKGQFFQTLDESGWQHESAVEWCRSSQLDPADFVGGFDGLAIACGA